MKRIIKWHSQHLEIETMTGKLYEPTEEKEQDYYTDGETYAQQEFIAQNVMSTPFGMWRVDDVMNPYKQFKLWMGHTNFSITQPVVKAIENVPGIEVLKVLSRYRFIIGVGELFDIRTVRTTIESALECNQNEDALIYNKDIKDQINKLREQLVAFDNWAIYVFPNGEIDYITSSKFDKKEFQNKLYVYKQAVDYSQGILIEKP